MEEIIYFELNNWFPVEDYPNAEPFITWCSDYYLDNEQFVKENELCVVRSVIDMSANWCVTAKRSWVEKVCPKLLSNETTSTEFVKGTFGGKETKYTRTGKYRDFLRFPDKYGMVYGKFGDEFLPWSKENIGITEGTNDWLNEDI